MILDCPACGARYRLPDDAIPAAGKPVRCARCKHSWVELGQPLDDEAAEAPQLGIAPIDAAFTGAASRATSAADPAYPEPFAPAAASPAIRPGPAEPAAATQPVEWEPEPDPPRRRRWLWLLPLLLLIALALGAAALITRLIPVPSFVSARIDVPYVSRPALSVPALDLPPLDLTRIPYAGPWLDRRLNPPALPPVPLTLQANADFRQLSNGGRMLALTGSVVNPTGSQQAVPDIEALVLDASRHPVYRWRIAAPLVALPSRSGAPFDSSASGYPASGTTVTLRFVRER